MTWGCAWARPVSDKLGPEAGWAGRTGLASRRVAGWAGPEPSLRHVRQAWPFSGFSHCQHIFRQKWTHGAGRRRTPKISRPAGQDFGPANKGGGGGAGRQNFGWGLGPFGAEANLPKLLAFLDLFFFFFLIKSFFMVVVGILFFYGLVVELQPLNCQKYKFGAFCSDVRTSTKPNLGANLTAKAARA